MATASTLEHDPFIVSIASCIARTVDQSVVGARSAAGVAGLHWRNPLFGPGLASVAGGCKQRTGLSFNGASASGTETFRK